MEELAERVRDAEKRLGCDERKEGMWMGTRWNSRIFGRLGKGTKTIWTFRRRMEITTLRPYPSLSLCDIIPPTPHHLFFLNSFHPL